MDAKPKRPQRSDIDRGWKKGTKLETERPYKDGAIPNAEMAEKR